MMAGYRKMAMGALFAILALGISRAAWAGPPFITDDPEPVDLHHWEVYVASEYFRDPTGGSGTLPHIEVNNGALPNLQLHIIMPYSFSAAPGQRTERGLGDTELGVKYRFIQETNSRPMVGLFPLAEVPSGDATRGLGSGHLQLFVPVWAQKSWGSWTSYGGGGYWINPGTGNRDYWLLGWLLQKDLSKYLTLGNELFYTSSSGDGVPRKLNFNFGGQYNFDDGHHFLFSAGRSLLGDTGFMSYVAYQWTFGPRERKSA